MCADRLQQRVGEQRPGELAAPERVSEREARAHRGRLGDGEDARVHTTDRHDEDDEERRRAAERRPPLGQRRPRAGRPEIGAHAAHDDDGDDEQRREQQAGQEPGEEQLADRLLRQDAVDDEHGGRRDQDAQRAAGRHHAGREARIVVVAAHLRQRDAAHRDRRRHRGAGEGGKAGAGEDRCRGEPAAPVPEPRVRRGEEVLAHPRHRREVAHQHEQRYDAQRLDGGIRERVGAEDVQRGVGSVEHRDADGAHERHGDADRHPQEKQREQRRHAGDAGRGRAHRRAWDARG
jgi:hypothetical protein